MQFKRASLAVASGNQRSREQSEIDRVVWDSYQALVNGDENSIATDPMPEEEVDTLIKRLDSAANFLNKGRGTNFRVKTEVRDPSEEDYAEAEANGEAIPEDCVVVAFKTVLRTERLSMRGPRGPRNSTTEENGNGTPKRTRKSKAETVEEQPEYQHEG